jgi:predicted HicB family RNase H-like nuclease
MPAVARVHYEIPDDLHRKAKAAAALQGVTLREFIVRALVSCAGNSGDKF